MWLQVASLRQEVDSLQAALAESRAQAQALQAQVGGLRQEVAAARGQVGPWGAALQDERAGALLHIFSAGQSEGNCSGGGDGSAMLTWAK